MEPVTAPVAVAAPPAKKLSPEEMNDLRRRVLMKQPLTIEEARDVIHSMRQGAAVAVLAGGDKPKKAKKDAMTDDALDADLDSLLKL